MTEKTPEDRFITGQRGLDIMLGILAGLCFPSVLGFSFGMVSRLFGTVGSEDRFLPWLLLVAVAIPGLLVHFFNRRYPAFALGFRWTLFTLFLLTAILVLGLLFVCGGFNKK